MSRSSIGQAELPAHRGFSVAGDDFRDVGRELALGRRLSVIPIAAGEALAQLLQQPAEGTFAVGAADRPVGTRCRRR